MSAEYVAGQVVNTDVMTAAVGHDYSLRDLLDDKRGIAIADPAAVGSMSVTSVRPSIPEEFHYEVGSACGNFIVAEEPAEYKTDRVFDQDTLTSYLEVILSDNPCAPDCMAQVLVRLKEAIESGEEGVVRTLNTLGDGIELMYTRTEVHRAALKLYTLSQLGYVRPQDEPMAVLSPAIERSVAEESEEKEPRASRKKRRSA